MKPARALRRAREGAIWKELLGKGETVSMVKQTMSNFADSPDNPFTDSDYYTGPPLTDEMIRSAESRLGYKLPESYLDVIRIKNGGSLKRSRFPRHPGSPLPGLRITSSLRGFLGSGASGVSTPRRLAATG